MNEHELQASIIAECELRANQDPRWGLLFAVPNGGFRSKATAGKLKAEGVKAGVPDLFLPVPRRATKAHPAYHGMFIELKVGRNRPTGQQQWWLDSLKAQYYYTCWIYDEPSAAIELLKWYLEGEV